MTIKITNLSNGKQILVKNQNDMNNLKNTYDDETFFKTHTTEYDPQHAYSLNHYDDADRKDYINRFSFFDKDDNEKDLANPTTDPYYDFDNEDDDQNNDNDNVNNSPEDQDQDQDDDSNFQGDIRTVTGADLVYKKQDQNGTYNELWVYTVGKDASSENNIRKAILSGTDIDPNTQESDDGTQKAQSTTLGNVQFIEITGLPQ